MDVDVAEEDNDPMDYGYNRPGPSTRTLPPVSSYIPRQTTFGLSTEVAERIDTQGNAPTGSVMGGIRAIKSLRRPRVAPAVTAARVCQLVMIFIYLSNTTILQSN